MNKKILEIPFLILFIIVCVIDLFGAYYNDDFVRRITKPLPLLVLTLSYYLTTTKINYWILASLIISFLADNLLLYKIENFVPALLLFTLVHILIIKVIYGYMQKTMLKSWLLNLLIFLMFFAIIFKFVLEDKKHAVMVIVVYGVSICMLASIAFVNYIYKINKANLFIFLGAFIHLISDGIYSINLFKEPKYIYTFSLLVTYFIAHYLLYKGFILKEDVTLQKNL